MILKFDVSDCDGGETIRYVGASDAQVNWGGCDDPRPLMKEGDEFIVYDVERHSYHTKVRLEGVEGQFNSVCFEVVHD